MILLLLKQFWNFKKTVNSHISYNNMTGSNHLNLFHAKPSSLYWARTMYINSCFGVRKVGKSLKDLWCSLDNLRQIFWVSWVHNLKIGKHSYIKGVYCSPGKWGTNTEMRDEFLKSTVLWCFISWFIHSLKIYITALLPYLQNNSQEFIDKKLEFYLDSVLNSAIYWNLNLLNIFLGQRILVSRLSRDLLVKYLHFWASAYTPKSATDCEQPDFSEQPARRQGSSCSWSHV